MRERLARFGALLLALSLAPLVSAQYDGVFSSEDSPFVVMEPILDDASIMFGIVAALCIVVTGFFLGRRWLRSV